MHLLYSWPFSYLTLILRPLLLLIQPLEDRMQVRNPELGTDALVVFHLGIQQLVPESFITFPSFFFLSFTKDVKQMLEKYFWGHITLNYEILTLAKKNIRLDILISPCMFPYLLRSSFLKSEGLFEAESSTFTWGLLFFYSYNVEVR